MDKITLNWIEWLGYVGALLNISTYAMKTMIPLRVVAIITNCIFIVYGYVINLYLIIFLHLVVLPINIFRLYQMIELVKKIKLAVSGDLSIEWLIPFMTKSRYRKNEIIFNKGEIANELFYVVKGRFHLIESGIEVEPGKIVGELGILVPTQTRTQTLECTEDGEMYKIGYSAIKQLYFQNPNFGFYFLQLTTGRLFENVETLENQLIQMKHSRID